MKLPPLPNRLTFNGSLGVESLIRHQAIISDHEILIDLAGIYFEILIIDFKVVGANVGLERMFFIIRIYKLVELIDVYSAAVMVGTTCVAGYLDLDALVL